MIKTICFLGDSITAAGIWESEIFEKARHDKIKLFNCGVPGDNATDALDRLYSTCLTHCPDMVSIMFGVNDNNCGYYYKKERTPEQLEAERIEAEERFERYCNSMRKLCELITDTGAELVLCTPVPFDNVTGGEMDRDFSIPLDRCVPFVRELAKEFGAKVVDFNGEMKKYMENECIFKEDRVHPNDRGYRLMAQIWSAAMFDGKYATNADDELVLCEKLMQRREIEVPMTRMWLVEYCFFHSLWMKDGATLSERIAEAEKRLSAAKEANNQTSITWYKDYLDNINNKEKIEGEYIKLTFEIANNK